MLQLTASYFQWNYLVFFKSLNGKESWTKFEDDQMLAAVREQQQRLLDPMDQQTSSSSNNNDISSSVIIDWLLVSQKILSNRTHMQCLDRYARHFYAEKQQLQEAETGDAPPASSASSRMTADDSSHTDDAVHVVVSEVKTEDASALATGPVAGQVPEEDLSCPDSGSNGDDNGSDSESD